MHPSSIMSFYPTYSILDEILSTSENYDTLNIYIDLKNNLQSLYMKHTIENIVSATKLANGFCDTSIFTSVLSFLSFHKIYASKRDIKINFFIFFESGESYYHKNISKKYKISRKIDDLYGLDYKDRELFFEVLRANLTLIEKTLSHVPFTKVIRLHHMEADFIPYYLITRNIVDTSPNIAHVVYSNDHDIYQTVRPNVFQFSKAAKKKKIVKHGNVMFEFLKRKTNLSDDFLSLAMAVCGDPGDDVYGIKGIGPKTFSDIALDLEKMVGGIPNLYNNVEKGKTIFDPSKVIKNKYINKVLESESKDKLISNNLKLVSFELISRFIENPSTTEVLERKNKILTNIAESNIVDKERMYKVLEMRKVYIQFDDLEVLYHGFEPGG